MHVVGHNRIRDHIMSFPPEYVEKFVNGIVTFSNPDQREPFKTGEGDEIRTGFCNEFMFCHKLKSELHF